MKVLMFCAACVGLMLSGTAHAGEITLKQAYSGTSHETAVDENGDGLVAYAGNMEGRGAPGRGTLTSIQEFTALAPYGTPGCDLRSTLVYQSWAETFRDGSMIFFETTEGYYCVDLATSEVGGEISGIIVGGTGRFEGATGYWSGPYRIYGLTNFAAFTGTLNGKISVPRTLGEVDIDD